MYKYLFFLSLDVFELDDWKEFKLVMYFLSFYYGVLFNRVIY